MQTETETKKISATRIKRNTYWVFWIFPVIALLICAWITYEHIHSLGPTIKISFEDAAGLQTEKTAVRFRGVDIGIVKQISISDDTQEVIASIQLQADAKSFAQEGARFWIVTPQVSFQGIKGLETLIEGAYIAALPGRTDAEEKLDFKGSTNSELTDPLENTSVYYLETSNAESINPGDSVTYRGLSVGSVTKVSLSKNSQVVVVQINLQNRYAKLIRTNTSFWRKTGIQASVGLFGSKVKINSLNSIINGGIDFFTPTEAGPRAKNGARYNLSAEAPKESEKWNPILE